jgi:hypothetical protein
MSHAVSSTRYSTLYAQNTFAAVANDEQAYGENAAA